MNYGLSGPMLRASGVAYDVRKDFPYLDYETYDFDVPVGTNGDVYDRYPRAHGGDAPVGAHSRAGDRAAARRSGEHRRPRASSCRPRARRRATWNR